MRTAPYSPAWSTRIMAAISVGEPGAGGFGLRGMFAAQKKRAGCSNNKREDRIISRQRKAEQAPSYLVTADLGRWRTRAHHVRMRNAAGFRSGQEVKLHAELIGTDQ